MFFQLRHLLAYMLDDKEIKPAVTLPWYQMLQTPTVIFAYRAIKKLQI